jgi:ATP-binding cassette, subfamily B, multidrug efflux pump
MRLVFYAPIMAVGGIIRAIESRLVDVVDDCRGRVVLLGVIIALISIALPKFRIMQKLIDRLNLVARENLSGMMVIRAFNMQPVSKKSASTRPTRT